MVITKAMLEAELKRFHMRCGRCDSVEVPQLLPDFEPIELVRAFLREHPADCQGPSKESPGRPAVVR